MNFKELDKFQFSELEYKSKGAVAKQKLLRL